MGNNYPGKLIVIDGADGSGKTTQIARLKENLRGRGFQVEIADFPQYNTKSAGLIEEYLSGRYGSPEDVGPYRASILYACDRYDASFKIKDWLKRGKIVIANRYVAANMGHQGAKIQNPLARKFFFEWLYQLEYEIFSIPRPDLNIILMVDASIAQDLAAARKREDWIGKTRDIHEESLTHLKRAEAAYLEISRSFPDMALIQCAPGGKLLEREEISELVLREITDRLILSRDKIIRSGIEDLPELIRRKLAAQSSPKMKIKKISRWSKNPVKISGRPGFSICSADYGSINPGEKMRIKTGLKITIPKNYLGIIGDHPDRGDIKITTKIIGGAGREIILDAANAGEDILHIAPGEKIARLLIQKIAAENIKTPEEISPPVDWGCF